MTSRRFTSEKITIPYLRNAIYERHDVNQDVVQEIVTAMLIGKEPVCFSERTDQVHQAFFVAKAAYAFEVLDVTDHWFGDDLTYTG